MTHRFALQISAALISIIALAGNASACACCANPGQRTDMVRDLRDGDGYELNEVERVVFGKEAELFIGEGEPENVTGLDARTSTYEIAVSKENGVFTMTFKEQGKVAGTLTFPTGDARLRRFEVDTRVATQDPPPPMVSLYKEWTLLPGSVTGTGMFKLGDPSSGQLILQGRGNSCTTADDFTHWNLRLTGRDHDFHFFGSLQRP